MPVRRFMCEGRCEELTIRRVVTAANSARAHDRFVKKFLPSRYPFIRVEVKEYGKYNA